MSDKCKFCGASPRITGGSGDAIYECDTWSTDKFPTRKCHERQIAALQAELKQLRDEDDTPPIDERLAAAGKIFRELVAEREELRREVERLRDELAEAKQ